MASRSKELESPLTLAAITLETELGRYEQTVRELETTAITSEKTLQRARTRLEQCVALEERLGAALQSFAEAMNETQARQQRCMEATRETAHRIEQRFAARNALLDRVRVLGERAKSINATVAAAMSAGPEAPATAQLLSSLQAVGELTSSIIDDADSLQRAAKADDWADIERDTGTLKQQLQAARNKVLVAHRSVAGRTPS